MLPDRIEAGSEIDTGDGDILDGDPRVLLFMQSDRNRELLVEMLAGEYEVETATSVEALDRTFDCCVFDTHEFNRVAGTIQSRRDTSSPIFLPFVLLVGSGTVADAVEVWEYVDDVIELPVDKAALRARLENLVDRRRTSLELAEREAELADTVEDLRLKERAMDEAPIGITIAGPDHDGDNPLLYANEQFETITGYDSGIIGKDCRFLQGGETSEATMQQMREAIEAEEPVSVDVLNYRQNGQKFWNDLDIAPIHDDETSVTHYVGFQTEITERKIREQRLEVLNRVLSHNLRNKMSIIQGYLTLLRDEYPPKEVPESVSKIESAAGNLLGLAESVQDIERTLRVSQADAGVVDLATWVDQMVSAFRDRFPAVRFEIDAPTDEPCEVAVVGLTTAIEEAIENAVKHNTSEDPTVEIAIERRSQDWIDIRIADNGPGIPSQELEVLKRGEKPLRHADRLGIWLMYWVVSRAGGEFSVDGEEDGTELRFSVPAHPD
jgi:PAS domain S-box-containing protein